MNFLEMAARKKLGKPPEWKAYRFEAITDCFLIEGAIPVRYKSRGPGKGHPVWKGGGEQVIVTNGEVDKEFSEYQATTGNCGHCMGTGMVFQSWSQSDGLKQMPCDACNGTGKVHKA